LRSVAERATPTGGATENIELGVANAGVGLTLIFGTGVVPGR